MKRAVRKRVHPGEVVWMTNEEQIEAERLVVLWFRGRDAKGNREALDARRMIPAKHRRLLALAGLAVQKPFGWFALTAAGRHVRDTAT